MQNSRGLLSKATAGLEKSRCVLLRNLRVARCLVVRAGERHAGVAKSGIARGAFRRSEAVRAQRKSVRRKRKSDVRRS